MTADLHEHQQEGRVLKDERGRRCHPRFIFRRYDSYEEYQHERLKREEYRRDYEKREFERAEQQERQKQKAIVSRLPFHFHCLSSRLSR